LRAIAVAGPKRSALMPEVPTMKEAGVEGVEVPLWFGLLAPAATPKDVIATLAAAVAKAAKDPETRKKLEAQGAEPDGTSPAEFTALLRAEVVKISGAKAN
jgi:tripartite-type tricarboxylate transporter receptor subunit TctC